MSFCLPLLVKGCTRHRTLNRRRKLTMSAVTGNTDIHHISLDTLENCPERWMRIPPFRGHPCIQNFHHFCPQVWIPHMKWTTHKHHYKAHEFILQNLSTSVLMNPNTVYCYATMFNTHVPWQASRVTHKLWQT